MRLWTLQESEVLEPLLAGAPYRADELRCWPYVDGPEWGGERIEAAYDWMAARLDHRDPRPPNGPRWPVWAWRSWNAEGPQRPDLRSLRPMEPGVLLELDVANERVLLSDFDGWHNVLNDCHNGRGFERYWAGVDAYDVGSPERAELMRRKRKSWRRCLAVNDSRATQAVLWEIRPEDVVRHWSYRGFRSAVATGVRD